MYITLTLPKAISRIEAFCCEIKILTFSAYAVFKMHVYCMFLHELTLIVLLRCIRLHMAPSKTYVCLSGCRSTFISYHKCVTCNNEKGKQKSPGRATSRSYSQPPTPGEREKVTQINVCIANIQMHDKHKDQLPFPQAGGSKC